MGISQRAFAFVLGGVLSLALAAPTPLKAASIYFCTSIGTAGIYQAGAGDEDYSLVAALPGCGYGAGGNPGPGGSIAVNSQGNIFQADRDTGDIYEITPSGGVSTFASGLIGGTLNLAFDSNGDLFVAHDTGSGGPNAVYEYTPAGVQSTVYSGTDPQSPSDDPFPLYPGGLAVDANGNVFVIAGGCIDEITPGGSASVFSCPSIAYGGLEDLAFDGGTLFGGTGGSNGTQPSLYEFASNGTASLFALDGGGTFTFDDSGNLFYSVGQMTIDEIPTGGGQSAAFSTRIFPVLGPMVAYDAVSSTPEPDSFILLLTGIGLLLLALRFGRIALTSASRGLLR